MSDMKENVKQEISWYNNEIERFKSFLSNWLEELNYKVQIRSEQVTRNEEFSGQYETKEYQFIIGDNLKITVKPFAIRIIGAKGRIDVDGSSGSEKFVYLTGDGPNVQTQIGDNTNSKNSVKCYLRIYCYRDNLY